MARSTGNHYLFTIFKKKLSGFDIDVYRDNNKYRCFTQMLRALFIFAR